MQAQALVIEEVDLELGGGGEMDVEEAAGGFWVGVELADEACGIGAFG